MLDQQLAGRTAMNNDFTHKMIAREGVIAGLDQLEKYLLNRQFQFALVYLEDLRIELKLDSVMEELCNE